VPLPRAPGQLREGLRYVARRHDLLLVILVTCAVGTFGLNFQITTALMATGVFHAGATAFGLLTTAFALGSLGGALLSARRAGRSGGRPTLRYVIGLAAGFAVLETIAGVAPTYAWFFLLLIPTGLLAISFATSANPFIQLGTEPQVRGRVMALYTLMFFGGTPLGAPFIGWLAEKAGARWSLIGGGSLTLACIVAAVAVLRPRPVDEQAAKLAYARHAPAVPVSEDGLGEEAGYPVDGRARA